MTLLTEVTAPSDELQRQILHLQTAAVTEFQQHPGFPITTALLLCIGAVKHLSSLVQVCVSTGADDSKVQGVDDVAVVSIPCDGCLQRLSIDHLDVC